MYLPYRSITVRPLLRPASKAAVPPFNTGEPIHIHLDDIEGWTRGPNLPFLEDGTEFQMGVFSLADELYLVASMFPRTMPLDLHAEGLQLLTDTPLRVRWFHEGRTSAWWKKTSLLHMEFKVGERGFKALEDSTSLHELATLLEALRPSRKVGTLLEIRDHPNYEVAGDYQTVLLMAL